jgi:hypothetical protein
MEHFFSIYGLIYIPLIFCIFIKNIKLQKKIMILYIIVITLFNGLRWDLGTDWYWYEKSFEDIDFDNVFTYITQDDGMTFKILEPIWSLLLVICKHIWGTYTSFLLLTNAIRLILLYKLSLLFTKRPIIVFTGFLVSGNFFPVRQDFAVILFSYGLTYIIKKKAVGYYIFNVVSMGIHQSATALLPLYFILNRFFLKYKYAILCFVLSYLFAEFFASDIVRLLSKIIGGSIGSVIDGYYYASTHSEDVNENLSNPVFAFILNSMFLTYFYYVYANFTAKTHHGISNDGRNIFMVLINCFIIAIVINQLFLRTFSSLARLSSYFSIATWILYARSLDESKNKLLNTEAITFLFFYLFYRYYKSLVYYPELHFPYRSIYGLLSIF